MSDYIFISYSWDDRFYVFQLAERMRAAGMQPWLFEHNEKPAEHYVRQLMEVIADAHAVIVILSPTSMSSASVQQEVLYAIDKRKRIIPLLLTDGDGPVRFLLRIYHWIDARLERYPVGQIAEALALVDQLSLPTVRLVTLEAYTPYVQPRDIVLEIPHHALTGLQQGAPSEVTICTFGLLPDRTIVIHPTVKTVSKIHAHICARWQGDEHWSFFLYDTSKNGTFINGERINLVRELPNYALIGLARDAVVFRFTWLDESTKTQ